MFGYIIWNPSPEAFGWGNFSLRWYGLCWGAAILLCYALATWFCKREKKDSSKMADLIIYVFATALIMARLAQAFFYHPDYYLQNPLDILQVWKGGLASHGGVVGTFLGMWLFNKKHREYGYWWLMDRTAIASLIAAVLIRIGNLINSELIGTPTDLPWAFVFVQVDLIPRHPVVLYEAFAYALIFVFLFSMYLKGFFTQQGIYLSIFLMLTFTVRVALEFFKEPEGQIFWIFSRTQLLSFPIIIFGIILFVLARLRKLPNL